MFREEKKKNTQESFEPTPLGSENSPKCGNLRRTCTTQESREHSRFLLVVSRICETQFIARGETVKIENFGRILFLNAIAL